MAMGAANNPRLLTNTGRLFFIIKHSSLLFCVSLKDSSKVSASFLFNPGAYPGCEGGAPLAPSLDPPL